MRKHQLFFCCIMLLHNCAYASEERKNEAPPKGILKKETATTAKTTRHVSFKDAAAMPTELRTPQGEPQKRIVQPLVNIDAPTDLQDALGDTSLIIAARHGSLELVQHLIQRRANPEIKNSHQPPRTALSEAADQGRLPIVRFLVEQKAQVNYENKKDRNPLSFAVSAGATDSLSVVEFLLDAKANVDAQDENGNSALYFATIYSKPTIVRSLLAHSANPMITNTDLLMPLNYARNDEVRLSLLEAIGRTDQKS